MIRFGRIRRYSDATLDDHLRHLVWTSVHGGGHDEECERPIVSTNEVTQEIVDAPLIVPVVTVRVEGTDLFGTGWYLHRDRMLFAISLWDGGRWVALDSAAQPPPDPTVFVALPPILGQGSVRFLREPPPSERALRID